MNTPLFDPESVLQSEHPMIRVLLDRERLPQGAQAAIAINATPTEIWNVVNDLDHLPKRIPMIGKVQRQGDDRIALSLKFRVSIFSASFGFVADVIRDPGHSLELRWVSGEPRNVHIRFEIHSLPHHPERSVLAVHTGFDLFSLGWLANYFLKGHPEIQFGVFPGSALSLLDAIDRAVRDLRTSPSR